jgi:hypothetical protein
MISYGKLSNYHLLQKYGFTEINNPYANVPLYASWNSEASLITQESQLKMKLYEKTGIPHFMNTFNLYDNKFDPNILASLRIAFLTTDMVDSMTFEYLMEKEDFKKPLLITQEEIILKSI